MPPKINIGPSGLLAAQSNKVSTTQLKYVPPPDAAVPSQNFHLYRFDENSAEPQTIYLNKTSFLIGRSQEVSDIVLRHDSVSKQHAVVQFRGSGDDLKAYLIDLESSNGTLINGTEIPTSRFVELHHQDSISCGDDETEFIFIVD